jgi:hypothetical protein
MPPRELVEAREQAMAVDEIKLSRALVSLCAVVRKPLVIDHHSKWRWTGG